jgi:hypothetical protein
MQLIDGLSAKPRWYAAGTRVVCVRIQKQGIATLTLV